MRIGLLEVLQLGAEDPGHVGGRFIHLVMATEVNDPPDIHCEPPHIRIIVRIKQRIIVSFH
jgi:hypothetical protein